MARRIYLDDIPLDEAWRRFAEALKAADRWGPFDAQDVALANGLPPTRRVWTSCRSTGSGTTW